jgi:DNA-binding MarR family transcriptional regulator
MDIHAQSDQSGGSPADGTAREEAVLWLERVLPRIMRRLIDSENLEMPLLQLPLAQMRLAQALYQEADTESAERPEGETMGRLSERLGVRHSALTQAADRLVNHGLAERFSDPSDRRVVRMRLTKVGRDWVEARRNRRRAHLAQLWTSLDGAERTQFLQALRVLDAVGNRLGVETAHAQTANASQEIVSTVEETLSHLMAGAEDIERTGGKTPQPTASATPGSYRKEGLI